MTLVRRAEELAARLGFDNSCIPEVGALVRTLAAGRRVAEIGTGCGVGAAWIAGTAAELVTVELDPELAAAARELLAACRNVRVLEGDGRDVLPPLAPFELVFLDGGAAKQEPSPELLELARPGGLFVLDDLTPGRAGPDPVREFWFGRDDVAAVEILTTPDQRRDRRGEARR